MLIKHLVVDDLREFDPPPGDGAVVYCRTLAESMMFLENNWCGHIEKLWLDFDLGYANATYDKNTKLFVPSAEHADTTVPFVERLIEACTPEHPGDPCCDIDTVYIVTANVVGMKTLFDLVDRYIPCAVRIVRPLDFNLVNKTRW